MNQEINGYAEYKIQLCNNVTPKDNNFLSGLTGKYESESDICKKRTVLKLIQ